MSEQLTGKLLKYKHKEKKTGLEVAGEEKQYTADRDTI